MKLLLTFLTICAIGFRSNAQVFTRKIILAGQNPATFSDNLFPSFTEGTLKMRDGKVITAQMNFTLVSCDIQFINSKGDTLDLTNQEAVDSIFLRGSVFFYIAKKGFFQIPDSSSSPIRLAIFRKTSYEPVKRGPMGTPTRTTSMQEYSSLIVNGAGTKELMLNVDIYVSEQTNYFFIGRKYTEPEPASKSSLLSLFENNQSIIENYIKTNKINFSKETDLKKVLRFCNASAQ